MIKKVAWTAFHLHIASFFRFMAANFSLTYMLTLFRPQYGAYLIPYFSFVSRKPALSFGNAGRSSLFPPENAGYPPPLPDSSTIYGSSPSSGSCGFLYTDSLSGIFYIDRIGFCILDRSRYPDIRHIRIYTIHGILFCLGAVVWQRRRPPVFQHFFADSRCFVPCIHGDGLDFWKPFRYFVK